MYSYPGTRRRRSRLLVAGVALLAAGLVAGGAYVLGQTLAGSTEDEPSTGQLAVPDDVALPPLPAAAPSDDPVKSATAWLTATRSQRFDDPTATAWIDRVKPVVTDRLAREYERYREGTVGAGWEPFVRDRCATTVLFDGPGGVIPEEAPRTRTSVSVQVAGSVQKVCQAEDTEDKPPVAVAATLLLRQVDGQWLVDFQQY